MESGRRRLAIWEMIAVTKWRVVIALSVTAGVLFALGWLVAVNPPLPPARSLVLKIVPRRSGNGVSRECTLLVSNSSSFAVEYAKGFNRIWVDLAYTSNDVWQTYEVRTPGVESCLLVPHAVMTNSIIVPENATAFKVGLYVTSLTWRGQLAFRMSYGAISRYLRRLTGLLLVQDEKRRSREEWSDEQNVADLWKEN